MSRADTFMIHLKELCGQAAVGAARLLPRTVRLGVGRVLISSLVGKKPERALRDLFALDDALRWYIDQAAIGYEDGLHPKHRLMRYDNFFAGRVKAGERVLDVGCGQGVVAYNMAEQGAYVTGIDLNSDNISRAKSRFQHERLEFVVGDARTYDAATRYEVLVMSNVLEHLDDRSLLLQSLWERHRPRALLFRLPMADRHWSAPLRAEVGSFAMLDPTHRIEYTVPTFIAEMAAAGLTVRHYQVNWGEIWAEVGRAGD